jgi:hypothetical protein
MLVEVIKMEPWKIIGLAAIAVVAVAFVTVTAFAYMGGQTTYNPYAPNGYTQGTRGGMMGGAYPTNSGYGYQFPNGYPQQSLYPQPYGQNGPWTGTSSNRGCH